MQSPAKVHCCGCEQRRRRKFNRGNVVESSEILARLSEIAGEHFDLPGIVLTPETTATDVPGWDSLAHIQLLMMVENSFGVRFKASEVSSFANVGQLADRIRSRLG